jgi:hypothetical protein
MLVKDINSSGDSNPALLIDVNGTLFFTAVSDASGTELWKSDGTEAGTVMVKIFTLVKNHPLPLLLRWNR